MWHRAFEHIEFGKVPVVAVLHGAVVGGGLELAAAAHVRVAERSAYYALPEGSRGIYVGGGASVRLPRLIGVSRMQDMMLTGRTYGAEDGQAHRPVALSGRATAPASPRASSSPTTSRPTRRSPISPSCTCCRASPRADPAGGYLTESLMAAIAQGSAEAKARLEGFPGEARQEGAARVRQDRNMAEPKRDASARGAAAAGAACAAGGPCSSAGPTARSICARRIRSEPIPTNSRNGWSIGRRPRPTASSSRSAPPAGAWRTLSYAQTLDQVRAIAQALLRPQAVARAADRDPVRQRYRARAAGARRDDGRRALCADLGALLADVDATSASSSRSSRILTPGLVFAADGKAFARAIEAAVPLDVEIVVTANPPGNRPGDAVRRPARDRADRRGRCRARQGRARHHRQNPVHLRLDRHAQGRHQHPAHAVLEPGDDPLEPGIRRRRTAGPRRLAAVEPHLRRQPRFRHGAAQRRLVLHRRGPAAARRHRGHGAQSARDRADHLISTCPRASRCCCRTSAATRRCAGTSSAGSRCCSTPAPRCSNMSGTSCTQLASRPPASASSSCPASVRPRRRRRRSLAPGNADHAGNIGLPLPGVELKLVPTGGKLEARLKGPNITPGLLAAARPHRGGVRRRGLSTGSATR